MKPRYFSKAEKIEAIQVLLRNYDSIKDYSNKYPLQMQFRPPDGIFFTVYEHLPPTVDDMINKLWNEL